MYAPKRTELSCERYGIHISKYTETLYLFSLLINMCFEQSWFVAVKYNILSNQVHHFSTQYFKKCYQYDENVISTCVKIQDACRSIRYFENG